MPSIKRYQYVVHVYVQRTQKGFLRPTKTVSNSISIKFSIGRIHEFVLPRRSIGHTVDYFQPCQTSHSLGEESNFETGYLILKYRKCYGLFK